MNEIKEYTKSHEIFEKSMEVIVGGVNSPIRAFIGLDVDPLIVERGAGDMIIDVNGKSYIDYCMSWGALILGHAHPKVVQSSIERLQMGSSFGIATELEEKIARLITLLIPSIEKVRFVSSGTEATMTALRIARGYTGRAMIIKFHGNYHGHSDGLLVKAGSGVAQICSEASSKGVPGSIIENTLSLPYNDIASFQDVIQQYSNDIAAVIIEPIAANMGVVPGSSEFLQVIRKETMRCGALLIFDEVITGFRVGTEGAQGLYKIVPDLTCLGKIVGGGFPSAVVGGKKEIMDSLAPIGEVYQAGTLSGNPVCMQAGLTTLMEIMKPSFYPNLNEKTEVLTKPIKEEIRKRDLNACLTQVGSMFTLFWGPKEVTSYESLEKLDKKIFGQFFRFALTNGVYFSPSPYEACFISSAHTTEHLVKTRELILDFMRQL